MTMDEVIAKIGKKEGTEIYRTISDNWIMQVFDSPYMYTEYEFSPDKQKLLNIIEYDVMSTFAVSEKSVEEFEKELQ